MSSEERITIDNPKDNSGKNKARVEAGKRLAEYNKAMRKRKELGETAGPEVPESNRETDDNEGINSTKTLMLVGLAGLGYYLYTTSNSKEKVQQQQQQPNVQNNNDVHVSRLRSFKN